MEGCPSFPLFINFVIVGVVKWKAVLHSLVFINFVIVGVV